MDFDDFDIDDEPDVLRPAVNLKDALLNVDRGWFARLGRKAKWLDLVGDFAGDELFVVDGESLLQRVLDDPLLAISRQDCSFQILHAYHTLERFIQDLLQRSANFDIVFWHSARYNTLRVGDTKNVVASRALARVLLLQHLYRLSENLLGFEVIFVNNLEDPLWTTYEKIKKPMFVMINDGGSVPEDVSSEVYARILLQRAFCYQLLTKGLSITTMSDLEFRDSKILSFVHEADSLLHPELLPIWEMVARKRIEFDSVLALEYPGIDAVFSGERNSDSHATTAAILKSLLEAVVALVPANLAAPLTLVFILHSSLLQGLPIKLRARGTEPLDERLRSIVVDIFLPTAYTVSASTLIRSGGSLDIDGSIFSLLLEFACTPAGPANLVELVKTSPVGQIWCDVQGTLPDLCVLSSNYPRSGVPRLPLNTSREPGGYNLLPFSNSVLDHHLSSVQIAVDHRSPNAEVQGDFSGSTLFADTAHWHNKKSLLPPHLGGEKPKPANEWLQRRALKRDQRFMENLQKQAATLTGASGKILERIIITPVGSRAVHKAPLPPKQAKAGKAPKAPKLTSIERTRLKIEEEKASKIKDASSAWWGKQLSFMEHMNVSEKVETLDKLSRSPRYREDWAGAEIRLYRLHLELTRWDADPERASAAAHDHHSVSVLRMVKDICDRRYVTATMSRALSSVLRTLGLTDFDSLSKITVTEDRASSFSFIKLVRSKDQKLKPEYDWMRIREHPVEWQLRLFGEFMDRSMDSAPDSRVAFDPDAWQRRVLDCIDRKSSLLAVAPTSAGKTFISYYAMEQVLRGSDDGILVYVAPTKALVMQIAAEVYARFSKTLKGTTCWAVHTRDYRVHNPQNCQILVTVPEVLSIMLLSPPLAKHWTPRLKWICLDEIHSIGQQEGGTVWEQILLMAPCPIIGLSATVGDPHRFSDWLASVQRAHGFDYQFIQHQYRYSHLRKAFYLIKGDNEPPPFRDLSSHITTARSRFIHPITALSFGASALPEDLALEAGDTLSLYRALKEVGVRGFGHLDPAAFFGSTGKLLVQKDIFRYEALLKETVSTMAGAADRLEPSSSLRRVIGHLLDAKLSSASPKQLNTVPAPKLFLKNLIFLLADLNTAGELPAILFNFDRTGCEVIAQTVTSALANAENRYRASNSEWKHKMEEWERWKAQTKFREQAAARAAKQRKDPDGVVEDSSATWHSSFDPEDPIEQFSFANHRVYSKAELAEDIHALFDRAPNWAIRALRRGVAVHHAGMNKAYRSLVEGLFRRGFLRVVIATGTLALGINAPAKTSVFCGDSPYLTALMYRQCAGRAGRRGYDLLGKVVFYGMTMDRVQRLILSRLPSLQGNFPLTPTLNLRLFNLLHGSDYAEVATRTVDSIMSLSQISMGSDIGKQHLAHHLRFSIEYLRRARLLDSEGRPLNLFAIAAHLYYTEPSNLALVALMRNGVLHSISRKKDFDARRDFILLLSHLFGRRYISRNLTNKDYLTMCQKKYPSVIVLPKMDPEARRVLVEHEAQTLRIYEEYAKVYTGQHAEHLGEDCKLPLSKLDFRGSWACEPAEVADSNLTSAKQHIPPPLLQYLELTAHKFTTRSAFVATSGHVDVYSSVRELTSTIREGLHLHQHTVPSFADLIEEDGDAKNDLNAYIYDFYTHGQTVTLSNANGIRRGEVWYALQEFSLTLMTIKSGLEQLLMKISKEAAADEDRDGDYDTADYAEADLEDKELGQDFERPSGVPAADWRVYEVVRDATEEFNVKYKAMWA